MIKSERITIMKKLTNDEKEQILRYAYTNDMFEYILFYTLGINCILQRLSYSDRLKINIDKGIFEWSKANDH